MATPKIHCMAQAASRAGLLGHGQAEDLLAEHFNEVQEAYLNMLDERERVRAEDVFSGRRDPQRQTSGRGLNMGSGAGEDAAGAPQANVL